ncbi:MAG: DUF4301 family protein [bacterium]
MNQPFSWTPADLEQMKSFSISPAELERQLDIFRHPAAYAPLVRPASLGDGIHQIQEGDKARILKRFEAARAEGRFSKFVPASGAASRMFQSISRVLKEGSARRSSLKEKADQGDSEALSLLSFMDALPQVAFFGDLSHCMKSHGMVLEQLLQAGDYEPILEKMMADEGLGYGGTSKGLIQFHRHEVGPRTALEEHIREGLRYLTDNQGVCRIHFTVSPEHRQAYERQVQNLIDSIEASKTVRFQIDFSEQVSSYQTIAVDLENQPFRDSAGRLLLRPAGHGALIQNLDQLGADLVFIKNIDNVVVEKLLETTLEWKKLLGGYLLEAQDGIFGYLNRLEADGGEETIRAAVEFIRKELWITTPDGFDAWDGAKKKKWLVNRLNRPLRVCGVVPNTGEPGGGPFWIRSASGGASLQIVESAQVDPDAKDQRLIFSRSSHFNPVDLVCALSDREGRAFSLRSYVDEAAVFISRKSHQGRDLKALELPGLWNGAMAGWTTLFVEVPLATFNPVKTVYDLLKPAHQG